MLVMACPNVNRADNKGSRQGAGELKLTAFLNIRNQKILKQVLTCEPSSLPHVQWAPPVVLCLQRTSYFRVQDSGGLAVT